MRAMKKMKKATETDDEEVVSSEVFAWGQATRVIGMHDIVYHNFLISRDKKTLVDDTYYTSTYIILASNA